MSEPLQFEYHPDADQIGAFVEQALPEHEREQILDHLAACPECRAIVALSLPKVEEPAQPQPAAFRKPSWLGWTLAWPVAGALAAAALFAVYIHHAAIAPNAPEQQVAVAHSAAPPVSQEPSPSPVVKPAMHGSQASPSGSQAISAEFAPIAPKPSHEATMTAQAVGGPIQTGRNVAALRQPAEAPPALSAGSSTPATRFSATPSRGLSSEVAGSVVKTPPMAAEARLQEMAPTQPTGTANPSAQTRAAAAPMPAAADAVEVKNGAPIETVFSNAANIAIAQDGAQVTQLKRPLPSHLPVLSLASQAQRMVAIDTGHAVFVSKDAGKHWKAIHAPWQGRAMKAALVEYGAGAGTLLSVGVGATAGASPANDAALAGSMNGALIAQAPPTYASKGSSISGTVTDMTGAAIPGASVAVTETTTGTSRAVKTDGAGRYIVDGLAPGTYRVEAQCSGFKEQELDGVAVTASGPSIANLSLTVGAATETVTVQAGNDAILTAKKTSTKPQASNQPAPVFEIVTDDGDRWTSADGVTWRHM
jgi:hypothetical protein